MPNLCSSSIALAAIMFAGGLHLNGQEQPAERPDGESRGDRAQAIARVDQISERLRGMEWTPGVVSALSGLGTVACRHDQDLGMRVFEKAYSVAAGIDFDLSEELSIGVLSSLASGATRCHPGFGFRSPTDRGDSSELEPQASLHAARANVRSDPQAAAGLFRSAAENFSGLRDDGQHRFVWGLTRLRQQVASEADTAFQHALLEVASSGSIADLFALGNYVFGPDAEALGRRSNVISAIKLPQGKIYSFSKTRPGIPSGLANLYIASASEVLFRKAASGPEATIAFGLTKQLADWAQSNAPQQSANLASLLATQRKQLAQGKSPPPIEALLRGVVPQNRRRVEEVLASAPDEPTRARIRFNEAANRIPRGELEGVRELVGDLEDEIRQPLLDIIELKRTNAAIARGELEAARLGLVTLSNDVHVVLAALGLASAYWNLAGNAPERNDEHVSAAAEAIQLASAAATRAPEHIRPNLRLGIARALVLTERFEESTLTLELAVQEFNADRESEKRAAGAVSVSVSEDGDVVANVTRGHGVRSFPLLPSPTSRTTFGDVVRQLSTSPEPDLDRLEGIVARAVDPRLRALGLAAVAEGYLSELALAVHGGQGKRVGKPRTGLSQQAVAAAGDQAMPN